MKAPRRHHVGDPIDVHHLGNGQRVVLRCFRPQDAELYRLFLCGLSAESRYNRLFNSRPVSQELIEQLTRVDSACRKLMIATIVEHGDERMIAEALLCLDGPVATAEFAIAVLDDWHGRGLGAWLLHQLICQACRTGMRRVAGQTLATNDRMLALARKLGFDRRAEAGCACVVNVMRAITASDLHSSLRHSQDDEAA